MINYSVTPSGETIASGETIFSGETIITIESGETILPLQLYSYFSINISYLHIFA